MPEYRDVVACRRCKSPHHIRAESQPIQYWICYIRDASGRHCRTMNVQSKAR